MGRSNIRQGDHPPELTSHNWTRQWDYRGADCDATMKLILILFVFCLAVHARPVTKARKTEAAVDPQQEVNLLMFGIIQFSQAFRYVHETTEAKVKRISQILQRQEETLQKLGTQAEQAAEVEKEMKEELQTIQVRKTEKICQQGETAV